jgi:hypothetical protein
MKKRLLFLFIFLSVGLLNISAFCQCGNGLLDYCLEKTKEERFLRSFPVQLDQQGKGEALPVRKYNMVLTSGSTYRITTCNASEFPGKVIVSVHYEDELLASSYIIEEQKHLPFLLFDCQTSGIYSLSFYFENGMKGCALGIISTE